MIELNPIIEATRGFGVLRILEGSSPLQEINNLGLIEAWKYPCSLLRSASSVEQLTTYVKNSHWVLLQDEKIQTNVTTILVSLARSHGNWDEMGTLESSHEDDVRENDPKWIDDRKNLVHGTYFQSKRKIVVWVFTDAIYGANVIPTVQRKNVRKWWIWG